MGSHLDEYIELYEGYGYEKEEECYEHTDGSYEIGGQIAAVYVWFKDDKWDGSGYQGSTYEAGIKRSIQELERGMVIPDDPYLDFSTIDMIAHYSFFYSCSPIHCP